MRMPTRRLQPVTATESRSHLQPGNLTLAHIASRWPRLFHLTEAGGWEAIREHGLLSTTALPDRFGITGPDRDAIESMRRPQSVQISHAAYGRAWIHDNKPVNAGALRRTLAGMSEEDWYREPLPLPTSLVLAKFNSQQPRCPREHWNACVNAAIPSAETGGNNDVVRAASRS